MTKLHKFSVTMTREQLVARITPANDFCDALLSVGNRWGNVKHFFKDTGTPEQLVRVNYTHPHHGSRTITRYLAD